MKSIEADAENADLATRAGWLRTVAGYHTKLGNRLINVVRTMKAKEGEKNTDEKLKTNEATMKAYMELAGRGSKQENLTDSQRDVIKTSWKRKRERKGESIMQTTRKRDGRKCLRESKLSGPG